jgi:hypothetical protein
VAVVELRSGWEEPAAVPDHLVLHRLSTLFGVAELNAGAWLLLAQAGSWSSRDLGHEMAQHAQFTIENGVAVFFCDPKSPWQRGSNENTTGWTSAPSPRPSWTTSPGNSTADSTDPRIQDTIRSTKRGVARTA